MILFEALVISGTLYAGSKVYRQLKTAGGVSWPKRWLARQPQPLAPVVEEPPANPAVQKANRTLLASSTSLGLATASVVLMQPALSLASIPLMLYVFTPTFESAWRSVRKERRVTIPVLDATRITLCVIMGYNFIAALNACLQALSQKLFTQAEAEFEETIQELFGKEESNVWAYIQGAEVEMPVAQSMVGDIIAVSAGDTIPANGVVLYGAAKLDQHIATGEVEPVQRGASEQVEAASRVLSGHLYVQLEQAPPPSLVDQVRKTFAQVVKRKTWTQQVGENSADKMAPRMLITFAIALPLLGANQAAAFLTTGFGGHMRNLGPYTVRNFVIPAVRHGILIKDARALELANLVNTIVFDASVLTNPTVRAQAKEIIHRLRQRSWPAQSVSPHRFAVYVFMEENQDAEARTLIAELGLDDYFAESLPVARAAVLERLRMSGRFVCYVGQGTDDALVMEKALVAISHRGVETLEANPAQVVIMNKDLAPLERFFDLAAAFATKQGFNLLAPIGLDIVDITTTLLVHFGLIYSVLFNYTGLLFSAAQVRLATRTETIKPPAEEVYPAPPALPLLDS